MNIARPLPAAVEAEERLIACVLIEGADMLAKCIVAGIRPDSFHEAKHTIIFERLLGLHAEQKPIGVDTLAADMQTAKLIEAVGGWIYLSQLVGKAPTAAEAGFFIETVRQHAILRAIIVKAGRVMEEAYQFTGDFEPITRGIERLAESMTTREESRTWAQAVKEAEELTRERMKPIAERKTAGIELSWGIPDFDRYFQKMEVGELIIIGGYTSSGKSSLLRNIAWAVAKAGQAALINTLEVRDSEEAINLAGHIAGYRSRANLDQLHRLEQGQLLGAFKDMNVPHFSVVHQDTNTASILARARAFKRKHGLRFLGVDYLQILEDVKDLKPGVRPDFAIGVVTSAMKRFATTEQTTVCMLSGFNRNYVRDGDRDPKLSDLEGSSNIEKDASRVLLIHVPTDYIAPGGAKMTQSLTADADEQPMFYVKIIQAKGRNQGTGSVGMMFHRETKTFRAMARTLSP